MVATQESIYADVFDWAVVRLATYFPASAGQARILFGSVSLLTKDRPRPASSRGADSYKVARGKSGKLFFRRTVLSAREAIAWYRSVGAHGITTPVPTDPSEVEDDKDGIPLTLTTFTDDPPWPSLGVPLGTDLFSSAGGPGDPAPFRGSGSPRVHRRFGDNTGFEAVIADDAAVSFLNRRLHLELADYTEYLGGLALVVPDPVLRRVQHFLIPAEDAGGTERVVYRLVSRPGQNFRDLKLTVIERRSNLLSRFQTVDVPDDGLVTVESSIPFDQTGYAISHNRQGVIAYQQPVPFLRAVTASIGVTGRRIKIQAPRTESPRSAVDSYEVNELAHEIPIAVGEGRHDANVQVAVAEQRRARRNSAKNQKQTWFDDGQRDEALSFIRRQIAKARSSVMVADPYFGALQIFQFLQAVPRTQIEFTILTSRLAFESERMEVVDPRESEAQGSPAYSAGTSTEIEKLRGFTNSLEALRARGMKSVAAVVLIGRPPPLHDRFLVIDDEVLFLGNSLNALGERASLILSVPDSEPILARLRTMVSVALPFEKYALQRGSTDASPSRGP
nr:VPA1262 family N-terminal domain-containing protein [Burkholderia multivorans]